MSNSKANIYNIPLIDADLNLNKYDAEIKQFTGFNKNNSPYVGGCISNVWKKEVDTDAMGGNCIVDKNGNLWSVKDNQKRWICKNGKEIAAFEAEYSYHKKTAKLYEYTEPVDGVLPSGECVAALPYDEENVYDYILFDGSTYYFCYYYTENDELLHGFITAENDSFLKCCIKRHSDSIVFCAGEKAVIVRNGISENISDFGTDTLFTPFVEWHEREYTMIDEVRYLPCFFFSGINNFGTNPVKLWVIPEQTPDSLVHVTQIVGNNLYGSIPQTLVSTNFVLFNGIIYYSTPVTYNPSGSSASMQPYYYSCKLEGLKKAYNTNYYYGGTDVITEMYNYPDPEKKSKIHVDLNRVFIEATISGKVTYGSGDFTRKFLLGYYNNYYKWVSGSPEPEYYSYFSPDDFNAGYKNNLGKFGLLYNNQLLSGISHKGTLLTEWYSLDDSFKVCENDNFIIYKNNNGEIKIISLKEGTENIELYFYGNKVFTNTGWVFDVEKNKVVKTNVDWNNRLPLFFYNNAAHAGEFKERLFASAVNPNYTDGKSDIVSQLLNPVTMSYYGFYETYSYDANNGKFREDDIPEGYDVDLYYSEQNSTNVLYQKTYDEENGTVDSSKLDLTYPIDTNGNILLSPSVFAKYIESGINVDLVKEGKDAFSLITYNNKKVYAYYLNTMINDVDDLFIIQGQPYAIIDHVIYSFNVQNGVLIQSNPILDIGELKFIAATPYQAFFYSPLALAVMSFTGANTLQYQFLATKVETVISSVYSPNTLSVVFVAKKELVFMTQFGIFTIEKITDTNDERVYATSKGIAVVYPSLGKTVFYRYSKTLDTDEEEYTKENIKIETAFYGVENQRLSVNDTLYIRLFDAEKNEGEVELSATTLFPDSKKTEKTTFTIKKTDWDEEQCTVYLRYQPKQQRGLGTSFKINSPFPIAYMAVSNIVDTNLVDTISQKAINAPEKTSAVKEW